MSVLEKPSNQKLILHNFKKFKTDVFNVDHIYEDRNSNFFEVGDLEENFRNSNHTLTMMIGGQSSGLRNTAEGTQHE